MFLDFLENGDERYFVLFKKPILIKMSISNGNVQKFRTIGNNNDQVGQFTRIFFNQGKILLVPLHSQEFVVYDENNDRVRKIEIPEKEISKQPYSYFNVAVQYEKNVYAFGLAYPGVVKIDLEAETAVRMYNKEGGLDSLGRGFGTEMAQKGEEIYLPLQDSAIIVKFNLKTEEIENIRLNLENDEKICTLCYDGMFFWVVLNNGKICKYDSNLRSYERAEEIEAVWGVKDSIIHGAYYKGNIFLFPSTRNEILRFSSINSCEYNWIRGPKKKTGNGVNFYYVKATVREIVFYSELLDLVYEYDQECDEFVKSKLQLCEDSFLKFAFDCADILELQEGEYVTLEKFIDSVAQA